MIVAFDLRYAADHFTGIGTHAFCLFESLLAQPGDERYVALWDPRLATRRYGVTRFAGHPRVEWVERALGPLDPLGPLRLGAWLRERRPDIYLSPFYFMPAGAPCPCVLTLHDVWPLRLPAGFALWRQAATRLAFARMKNAAAVVTSSQFSREEIVALIGLAPDRVHAIPLGVPRAVAPVEPRRPAALRDVPFALAVGDNRPRKNLDVLARAWATFGDSPPVALAAAGPAHERYPSIEDLARAAGARGVQGLGWIEEPELAWLFDHAEMILFPSRYEGFGFPLVEAFACGLPALAADIPTLREVGQSAAVFLSPDDPAAWAAAVRRLIDRPEERERLRAAGLARAAELDYAGTAAVTLELLRSVARGGSKGGG